MRTFDTGATRDSNESKPNYAGFLSPRVLERYAKYMQANQVQADGKLRSADNWKKGIPQQAYMESMFRHFMEVWHNHEAQKVSQDTLCALLFNVMGYLYEEIKNENRL